MPPLLDCATSSRRLATTRRGAKAGTVQDLISGIPPHCKTCGTGPYFTIWVPPHGIKRTRLPWTWWAFTAQGVSKCQTTSIVVKANSSGGPRRVHRGHTRGLRSDWDQPRARGIGAVKAACNGSVAVTIVVMSCKL